MKLLDISDVFDAIDWNPVTKEMAIHSGSSSAIYAASKKFAELAVWEWAEAHPAVDVTTSKSIVFLVLHIWLTKIGTVLPPFLYGPLPPQHLPLPKPEFDTISTNLVVYNLLFPNGVYMPAARYVDFRDVAQAHIGALDSKPDKKDRKRIIFVSPHGLTVKDVLDIIKKDHPDLERRFITSPVPQFPYDKVDVDFERIEEVTGMRKQDFRTLEQVSFLWLFPSCETLTRFASSDDLRHCK